MGLPVPADPDRHPGALVAAACAEFGTAGVVEWCAALLTGRAAPDDPERPSLLWIGGRPAAGALRTGRTARPDQSHWPRVWAARALRYAWTPAAAPAVARALTDPSWRVRETAARVAAARELPETVDLLTTLTTDQVPRVRAAALHGLGTLGEGEHAEPLRAALDDPAPSVATAAARALHTLRHRLDRDL